LFYIVMSLVSCSPPAEYAVQPPPDPGVRDFRVLAVPLLIGLAGVTLFWIASLIAGGAWALVSSGLINRLMEVAKEEDRSQYMALHNLTMNLGILAGSLFGPYLSESFGLWESMMLVAGIRLLSGIIMLRLG
jgi:predicted MFS family arabinose efflux permease